MFVIDYAPSSNKVKKVIFSIKVNVKVTRLLNFVSFEKASIIEYAGQN